MASGTGIDRRDGFAWRFTAMDDEARSSYSVGRFIGAGLNLTLPEPWPRGNARHPDRPIAIVFGVGL